MNINDYVYIKPTYDGLSVIRLSPGFFKILSGGWYQVQMWEFMAVFGAYMWLGNPKTYFENNTILFENPTK